MITKNFDYKHSSEWVNDNFFVCVNIPFKFFIIKMIESPFCVDLKKHLKLAIYYPLLKNINTFFFHIAHP